MTKNDTTQLPIRLGYSAKKGEHKAYQKQSNGKQKEIIIEAQGAVLLYYHFNDKNNPESEQNYIQLIMDNKEVQPKGLTLKLRGFEVLLKEVKSIEINNTYNEELKIKEGYKYTILFDIIKKL